MLGAPAIDDLDDMADAPATPSPLPLSMQGSDFEPECRFARGASAQSGTRRERGCRAGSHRLDDLAVVDALQVDGRDAKVRVTELALDDVERHAFACHLDRMGMAKLVRSEPPAHTRAD